MSYWDYVKEKAAEIDKYHEWEDTRETALELSADFLSHFEALEVLTQSDNTRAMTEQYELEIQENSVDEALELMAHFAVATDIVDQVKDPKFG